MPSDVKSGALFAEPAPVLPCVQFKRANDHSVAWSSAKAVTHKYDSDTRGMWSGTFHTAVLSQLASLQKYLYRVGDCEVRAWACVVWFGLCRGAYSCVRVRRAGNGAPPTHSHFRTYQTPRLLRMWRASALTVTLIVCGMSCLQSVAVLLRCMLLHRFAPCAVQTGGVW